MTCVHTNPLPNAGSSYVHSFIDFMKIKKLCAYKFQVGIMALFNIADFTK